MAALDGGDAGRIIAAILEPAQCIDQIGRNCGFSKNSNDATHRNLPPNAGAPVTEFDRG